MDEQQVDGLVSGWPGVSADLKWGDDLAYSVAGKMFAVYCFKGSNAGQVSFKVGAERFLELTDRHGIIPAPYMARAHWVSVLPSSGMPREELKALLRESYEQVRAKLPKKVQRELGEG
ncbi:MAG: MmcQ/YjbR family DNA-binding protein [Pseudomonadota bacterium]|jgi:predicted DNA-binding protein (MmcQ/YjbR family)